MDAGQIISIVCAVIWFICMGGASWCFYKANQVRKESLRILEEIREKRTHLDLANKGGQKVVEILEYFEESQKITTDIGIMTKKEYLEDMKEDLDKVPKSVKCWYDEESIILEFIY